MIDTISGIKGTVVAKIKYLSGEREAIIQPRTVDSKKPPTVYININYLEHSADVDSIGYRANV